MPLDHHYDREKKLHIVTAVGEATFEQLDQFLKKITSSDEYSADLPAIWDLRRFDFKVMDSKLLRSVIRMRERYPQRDGVRIALVVDSDVGFGVGRMYELITAVRRNPQTTKVFRDFADAERWIMEGAISP